MKLSLILSSFFLSSIALACPNLEGFYDRCLSDDRQHNGEYKIHQYMQGGVQYYHLQKLNTEDSEDITEETIRTDGVKVSRKEKLKKYGITVRLDTRSTCKNETVVGVSEAYSMGMKMGNTTTVLSRADGVLHIDIDGTLAGKELRKRYRCFQN